MKDYFVYITTNTKKTVLYIGITNNLNNRLDQHNQEACDQNNPLQVNTIAIISFISKRLKS